MREKNKSTLQETLLQLPEHDVPEMIWTKVKADIYLEAAIRFSLPLLPEHQPPDSIWNNLDLHTSNLTPPSRKPVLVRMWPVWAAVAAIFLLLCTTWLLQPSGKEDLADVRILYSEEKIDTVLLALAREPEDEAFQLVEEICRQPVPVCKNPEFIQLKAELDELTSAKSELREAMGQYETNPELTEQLTRIERERSDLLRRMMNMI